MGLIRLLKDFEQDIKYQEFLQASIPCFHLRDNGIDVDTALKFFMDTGFVSGFHVDVPKFQRGLEN